MAATAKEKFDAAVKVIRGLPKNGTFQPSNEMMLKFYAFFKQATEGPCTSPKPGIWNVVNRKKWEAWSELGGMKKEMAMLRYVDELKHIVETMPQTEHVAEFVNTLGSFYELIEEENKAGPDTTDTHNPGSPANGQEGEEHQSTGVDQVLARPAKSVKKEDTVDDDDHDDDQGDDSHQHRPVFNGLSAVNGHKDDTDEEEDDDEDEEEKEKEGEAEEKKKEEERKTSESSHSTAVDSGSDTEEFCDTSDDIEQVSITAVNTSAPSGQRSECRVRFATDVSLADESPSNHGNGHNLSTALRDMSALNSQMEAERLNQWTSSKFSYVPSKAELPARVLTESLVVNSSFSSLVSLAGSEVRAMDIEDAPTPDTETQKRLPKASGRQSRGGGEDRGGGNRTSSSTSQGAGGGTASYTATGSGQSSGGISRGRRSLLPSGSGGGDRSRGGQGGSVGSVNQQILLTLLHLQQDLVSIGNRLSALEFSVQLQREEQARISKKESGWWPFPNVSRSWVIVLILWPFIAPVIVNVLCRRRRRSHR